MRTDLKGLYVYLLSAKGSQGEPRQEVEEGRGLGRPHFQWFRRRSSESNFLNAQSELLGLPEWE